MAGDATSLSIIFAAYRAAWRVTKRSTINDTEL